METDDAYKEWLAGFKHQMYAEKTMTQKALAGRVRTDKGYINSLLKGHKKAGYSLQELISRALGMSYDQMRNLGREVQGLPPVVRISAELGAPHRSIDDESTSSVAQNSVNCSTVVNGGGSVNGVNGVNNGTVQACSGPPCPKTEKPMGDIARELCEMIATQLEGKNMDIQIAVRAQVKAALNAALEQAKMGR